MKKVGLSNHLRAEVKALTKEEREIIGTAISDIQEAFGILTSIRASVFANFGLIFTKLGLTSVNGCFSKIGTIAYSFSSWPIIRKFKNI